jgi:hypothetical protein
MASADYSGTLPPELSPSKVRNLSGRAARLYLACLSVTLDFAFDRMLIAHARPHCRFVFLRSSLCYRFFQLRLTATPCGSLRFTSLFPVNSFQLN